MNKGKYIYQSHLGCLYTSNRHLSYDECHCEECGDCDWELGYAETRERARELVTAEDLYRDEFIEYWLDREFPEGGEAE